MVRALLVAVHEIYNHWHSLQVRPAIGLYKIALWIPVVVEMNSTSNPHLLSDIPYSSITHLTQSTLTSTMVV